MLALEQSGTLILWHLWGRCIGVASVVALLALAPHQTTRAATFSINHNTFTTANDRSIWSEGPGLSIDMPDQFVGFDWDIGDSVGDITELCPPVGPCAKFGVKIGAETTGKVGFGYGLKLDSGTFDLQYPGRATFDINTGNGDPRTTPITIASSFASAETISFPLQVGQIESRRGPQLQVTGPTAQASVDLFAELDAFAGATVCVTVCYGPALDVSGNGSQELAAINRNNDGQVRIKGDVVAENQPVTLLDGLVVASLSIPDLDASSKTTSGGFDGTKLVSEKRDRVAGINANIAQIVANALGIPIPLSGQENGIGYTLLQAGAGLVADIKQRLEFIPEVTGTYFFSSFVTPIVNGIQQAQTRILNFKFGDVITFLAGQRDQISFQPFLNFGGTINNKTTLSFSGNIGVRALGANIAGQSIGPLVDEEFDGADFLEIPLYENSFSQGFGSTRLPVTTLDFDCFLNNPGGGDLETCGYTSFDFLSRLGPKIDGTLVDRYGTLDCSNSIGGQPAFCEPTDSTEFDRIFDTSPFFPSSEDGQVFVTDRLSAFSYTDINPGRSLTTDDAYATLRELGFQGGLPAFVIPLGRSYESFAQVPEPATAGLLGVGLFCIIVGQYRRRR
jgi:PEP-CTERM motif